MIVAFSISEAIQSFRDYGWLCHKLLLDAFLPRFLRCFRFGIQPLDMLSGVGENLRMEDRLGQLRVSHFGSVLRCLFLRHGDIMIDNLMSVFEQFGTDGKCRERLVQLKWPKGIECPRCQSAKISHVAARHVYDCDPCRYRFS